MLGIVMKEQKESPSCTSVRCTDSSFLLFVDFYLHYKDLVMSLSPDFNFFTGQTDD